MKYLELLDDPCRPNARELIEKIFTGFVELSGDRVFGDDPALIGGIALLANIPVTVIAQLRGKNIQEQMQYHFSMSYPEGYRKALRLMLQAEKFHRPIICFVDTIGAFPGRAAEERGQAVAIANNIKAMIGLKVPIVTVLIGYGGSGGALALCVADKLLILENAVFGVVSPKAYATIMHRSSQNDEEIINALSMRSTQLLEDKIVDAIILEPGKGEDMISQKIAEKIQECLIKELTSLRKKSNLKLLKERKNRFRRIGLDEC